MKRARVLVVDDKESFLALFRRILPKDLEVVTASDGLRALELLAQERFDVVVSDIRMPGADGMALLKRIRDSGVSVDVILMTAYGTVADAVRAMKYGAADYLTKPFDPDTAVAAVEQVLARRKAEPPPAAAPLVEDFPRLVGESPGMVHVFAMIERAAASDATVLVTGESGTGKELVARAIHTKSARSSRRFVAVNCGALPENLIESELFGHVRGAFTGAFTAKRGLFEEAAGGTLFLDEVGELPLAMQVKLTRVLQERAVRKVGATTEQPVDVRIIAATNVDLAAAVEGGQFREDLYYRLDVLTIRLPPLRDRRGDIPRLAESLLARIVAAAGSPPRHLSAEALALLSTHDWPGNVRQLENALARAVAVSMGDEIGVDGLPAEVGRPIPSSRSGGPLVSLSYRQAIAVERERATREYLVALLREVQGNVTQAAERAGIERESFHRLMKRHGVRAEDFRK